MDRNPHLRAAIEALGETNEQRAKRLGVTTRMIIWYLQGQHTPSLRVLRRANEPALLEAITKDAQIQVTPAEIAA